MGKIVERDGMKFLEKTYADPDDIEYYGDAVKYYTVTAPFEVDGIVYDPRTYESRGNVSNSMIDIV